MSKLNTPNSKTLFIVYLLGMGSLILGDHKFEPFKVHEVPAEVKDLACARTTPLKFFSTQEEAAAEVRALRAEWEKSNKTQKE